MGTGCPIFDELVAERGLPWVPPFILEPDEPPAPAVEVPVEVPRTGPLPAVPRHTARQAEAAARVAARRHGATRQEHRGHGPTWALPDGPVWISPDGRPLPAGATAWTPRHADADTGPIALPGQAS
jgi:hypothetical protein